MPENFSATLPGIFKAKTIHSAERREMVDLKTSTFAGHGRSLKRQVTPEIGEKDIVSKMFGAAKCFGSS